MFCNFKDESRTSLKNYSLPVKLQTYPRKPLSLCMSFNTYSTFNFEALSFLCESIILVFVTSSGVVRVAEILPKQWKISRAVIAEILPKYGINYISSKTSTNY